MIYIYTKGSGIWYQGVFRPSVRSRVVGRGEAVEVLAGELFHEFSRPAGALVSRDFHDRVDQICLSTLVVQYAAWGKQKVGDSDANMEEGVTRRKSHNEKQRGSPGIPDEPLCC